MAQVLIVYGTAYGQTERIASRIASELESHGHTVNVWKGDALPADLSLAQYQAFVVAASVISGKYQRYIDGFIREHASQLNSGPSAFVSVSGTAAAAPHEAREHAAAFLRRVGWRPDLLEVFGGAIAYTQYGFVLRWITKLISRRRGGPTDTSRDHDMTDWGAVDRFAGRLAETLPPPPDRNQVESVPRQSGSFSFTKTAHKA